MPASPARRRTVRLGFACALMLVPAACAGPGGLSAMDQASARGGPTQSAPDDPVRIVAQALEERLNVMLAAARADALK